MHRASAVTARSVLRRINSPAGLVTFAAFSFLVSDNSAYRAACDLHVIRGQEADESHVAHLPLPASRASVNSLLYG